VVVILIILITIRWFVLVVTTLVLLVAVIRSISALAAILLQDASSILQIFVSVWMDSTKALSACPVSTIVPLVLSMDQLMSACLAIQLKAEYLVPINLLASALL